MGIEYTKIDVFRTFNIKKTAGWAMLNNKDFKYKQNNHSSRQLTYNLDDEKDNRGRPHLITP